jgi:hypothetical protein
LLEVLNPSGTANPSDGAIYTETTEGGQAVFVNFDLCASVNHFRTECTGAVGPVGLPTFNAGAYYGRVELMYTILNTIMGLASQGFGNGGTSGIPTTETTYRWALHQNTPNPCSNGTEIRFEVARSSNISIKVYNAMGQLVRTVENRKMQPGRYSVRWDGTNAAGHHVSSGVYFYKMETGRFAATKKMLVVR